MESTKEEKEEEEK